jgi:hypothetical protein
MKLSCNRSGTENELALGLDGAHASSLEYDNAGADRPPFAKPWNYISVRDENGTEIFEAPIKMAART